MAVYRFTGKSPNGPADMADPLNWSPPVMPTLAEGDEVLFEENSEDAERLNREFLDDAARLLGPSPSGLTVAAADATVKWTNATKASRKTSFFTLPPGAKFVPVQDGVLRLGPVLADEPVIVE